MAAIGCSGASATQYDVFLSFGGPDSDTHDAFIDRLYRTMFDEGIVAYRDSEEPHAGDRMDDLLRAVGNSKIFIPVLSRGYASSARCLRQLARVTELHESTGKPEILPIFFDVTPSDVKLRTELYLKDLEKHEQGHGAEMRQRWEAALGKVDEIKGWEVPGKAHSDVIELVVEEVLHKLKVKQRPLDNKLVGVDKQVEAIMDLLDVDSGMGVRFVGIHGRGGIGKTTLAKIVFNKLCLQFDGQCSFIGNIRESSKGNGLVNLQKQLASDISDSRFVENFSNTDEGIDSITRRASSKKVLIVLDNLDKKEQLEKLAGDPNTFCSGSRIIITTRDKRILDEENGLLAYEVKEMDFDKALELFSLHAFNRVSPPNAYRSLSREVVSLTRGLPLALEVIGSYLHDQKVEIWMEMLEMLKNVPHDEVRYKLKISYDALGDEEKEVFLDISCFFISGTKSRAACFRDAFHLLPHKSLKKLTDLCLIKIVDGHTIWMHDQLRDLGRDIVKKERTPSSLWNDQEALKVMRSKERKDKVKALNLGQYKSLTTPEQVLINLRANKRPLNSILISSEVGHTFGVDDRSVRRRINSWQKGEKLGRGSFGDVYKGFSDDGFFFAVKEVCFSDQGSHGKESLSQEISILSHLQHENIVQYYGTKEDDKKLYIFLELMTEGSLETLYRQYNLSDLQVSAYTKQILNGLKYLHDQHVVHRDIKCANLLVDARSCVKLADFGLAKVIKKNDAKSSKGSLRWMAPEVVNPKNKSYGLAADIWSLGCTVLEMLTRQYPYSHLEEAPAVLRIGRGELPPLPPSLSRDAEDFILSCLEVDPNKRPSAAQLLDHAFVRKPPTPGCASPCFNNMFC